LLEGQEDNAMTRSLLITAASLAALIAPAQASALGNNAVSSVAPQAGSGSSWHGGGHRFANLGCESGRDRDRRDRDGRGRGGSGCAVFGDSWGYYDPEVNRSWDSDSYNDWWHDRPDRAFPRWVQHNEGCEPDRMWWSGGGWHC
jgi:hypothetical protein